MKTIDYGPVKGYAPVSARIKEFREKNPNGKIITRNEVDEDGLVTFMAYIWKDKKDYVREDVESADSSGTARNTTKDKKDFEKLETVAIGRALSILGYMVSGEVASSEEMEMALEKARKYDDAELEKKIANTIKAMKKTKNLDELKQVFLDSGLYDEEEVVELKNKLKEKFEAKK